MVRLSDRRWLIVVVNVAALFVVLGRAREGWSAVALGPYLLWAALVGLGVVVALLWSDEPRAT